MKCVLSCAKGATSLAICDFCSFRFTIYYLTDYIGDETVAVLPDVDVVSETYGRAKLPLSLYFFFELFLSFFTFFWIKIRIIKTTISLQVS